jgi:fermentation-respiration switch protein FrsA (DUF1100 family)
VGRRGAQRIAVVVLVVAVVTATAVFVAGSLTPDADSRTATATTSSQHLLGVRNSSAGSALASSSAAAAVQDPATQYAVGISSVTYIDTTRSTEARGEMPAEDSRTIAVTLRYPIAGNAGDDETTGARARAGAYPLVVFAHGYGVSAETYAALEHQLAAAGFVVAAPDFPLTSSAIEGAPDEDDVLNQATDVSFVIDSLLDATQAPSEFSDAIVTGPVGVVGHSDGGVTAAAVAYNSSVADSRIGAAVILSGAAIRYPGSWFETQSPPLLAIHGTDDEVNPFAGSTSLYESATGPAMLVAVPGGSHLEPFTTDATEPAIGQLVADFLRTHLAGDAAAAGRLEADANVDGELALVASTDHAG